MRIDEFYKIADELAPKALSDEYCRLYGAYDNSGILLDIGEEIRGVVFSLDFSFAAIEKAIGAGANLIVTHHPAIYGKIGDIRVSDFEPLDKKIVQCIQNGISVLSMHLNLDGANGGTDESFAQGVAHAAGGTLRQEDCLMMHPLTGGGYGRAYDVREITLSALAKNLKDEFQSKRILFYGDGEKTIKRAASFCGAGADEAAVEFAVKAGADALISADIKHHVLALATECGLSVIVLTHYASEQYGFKKYYQKICQRTNVPCVYHTDETLL